MYHHLGEEAEEEGAWAVNEAAIYFEDDKLTVAFGDGKIAQMDIERDEEQAVVRAILSDANTWAAFLGSLSAALKEHM
jgi:hypothetical protein